MEGLKIWQEWKPDVIVSDIEMPVMDGYEMVKRIRETDTDTPILFSSGRVSPKDVVKGYELGVNNYLKKPFLPEELNAHVQALMKMSQKAPEKSVAPTNSAQLRMISLLHRSIKSIHINMYNFPFHTSFNCGIKYKQMFQILSQLYIIDEEVCSNKKQGLSLKKNKSLP